MKTVTLIILVALSGLAQAASQRNATVDEMEVVSFRCGQNSAYYSAKLTVKNISNKPIDYARVYIRFEPEGREPFVDDEALRPHPIQPGMLASTTFISDDDDGRTYSCKLEAIQIKE